MHKPCFVDIHVLQTVPPSCINRDDTGSPKTARFGGVRRARVSSQAWKKAMRDEFAGLLDDDEIGVRTKDVVAMIAERIVSIDPSVDMDEALDLGMKALKATGISIKDGKTGYLLFVGPRQTGALAELALSSRGGGGKIAPKAAKPILNPRERPTLNAVDVALFGRMVADAPDLNVDAAAQVAHALGVGVCEPEFDYFTAMDDRTPEDESGAGMIGTVEYLSATLYRYATLDIYHLCENLGSADAAVKAADAFVKAFVLSMPTGKQNTFANRTLPSAVVIQVRDTQPVSLVTAFERPVFADGEKSQATVACERLAAQEACIEEAFGSRPRATYAVCAAPQIREALGPIAADATNLDGALKLMIEQISSYLETCGIGSEAKE